MSPYVLLSRQLCFILGTPFTDSYFKQSVKNPLSSVIWQFFFVWSLISLRHQGSCLMACFRLYWSSSSHKSILALIAWSTRRDKCLKSLEVHCYGSCFSFYGPFTEVRIPKYSFSWSVILSSASAEVFEQPFHTFGSAHHEQQDSTVLQLT